MNPAPLKLLLLGLLLSMSFVWLSEKLLWWIYNPVRYLEMLAEADAIIEKLSELRGRDDRRSVRRRAMLEARLAPIRSAILRVSLLRGILYTLAYLAVSSSLFVIDPRLYPAPAYIPLLTIVYKGGFYYGAPQVAMLSTVLAIMVLMGPPRLRTVGAGRVREGSEGAQAGS